jgi:hypothetical protein
MDDAIKTLMVADTGAGGCATLLTGGIYTRTELGLSGITEDTAPSAFDSTTGLLKPCALIVTGEEIPDEQIVDEGGQVASYEETARIYIYQDGSTTRSTAETVANRVYKLFHGKQVSYKHALWKGTIKTREPAMQNAHLVRVSLGIHGVKS